MPKKTYYENAAKTIIKNLEKRQMNGFYVEDSKKALEKVLELVPDGASVGWGGSSTLKNAGILQAMNDGPYIVYDRKKASTKEEQKDIVSKLQWLGDFITLSDEVRDGDAKEYYDTLRRDIFEANVYVLTPQGKIVELPNGSTTIDFAYRIHTEVGHRMVGALINNVMVPINTKLNTGDVCEIKTNKNSAGPSEDWLKIVRTAGARNKIRQFISKRDAENQKNLIVQ